MNVKGFNITLRQDGKKLVVTNTTVSNCVEISIKGSTALNYGFNGDLETLTSDITITNEDFIRFVNALESAKNKILEQMPKPQPKTTLIVDTEPETKPKKVAAKKTVKRGKK